jgi:hypothetical protein
MNDTNQGAMDSDRDGANETADGGGAVNRRKFVTGASALGVAGVAGCLGDGGDGDTDTPTPAGTDEPTPTSPAPATGTDTETETPTDTETPTPGESEFGPIPANLTYQYFEGGFSEIPDFDNLAPTSSGDLTGGKISLDPAEREENFGLVFEGELVIGGRLHSGTYTFAADASDAMKLYVNGIEFLDASDGAIENSVRLREGTHAFRVEYVHTTGSPHLGVGWRGTFGQLLPRLAKTDPFREDLGMPMVYQGPTDPSLEMDVGSRPRVKRIQMPGTSAKALAVGMPDLTNYCFDPTTGGVKYAWTGAFINYGPIIDYGEGRGDNEADVLGLQFPVGGMDYPLRIGDADAEPAVEFLGCREAPHPPELWYTVDGHEVTHTVEGVSGDLGVTHTIGFEEAPSALAYFHTGDGDDVRREATAGEWNGETLEVPAGVEEFSVTITARRV